MDSRKKDGLMASQMGALASSNIHWAHRVGTGLWFRVSAGSLTEFSQSSRMLFKLRVQQLPNLVPPPYLCVACWLLLLPWLAAAAELLEETRGGAQDCLPYNFSSCTQTSMLVSTYLMPSARSIASQRVCPKTSYELALALVYALPSFLLSASFFAVCLVGHSYCYFTADNDFLADND